jgi:hypothetical protein
MKKAPIFSFCYYWISLVLLVSLGSAGCAFAKEPSGSNATLPASLSVNDAGKATEIANDYITAHYGNDPYLKDKSNPSRVTEELTRWVIFYEDEGVVRLPSGVEVAVEKKTGHVSRLNQE